MKFKLIGSFVLLAAGTLLAAPGSFNVRDFGAKGDGKNDDRPAFAKTFAAAAVFGKGAKVFIPRGKYRMESLDLVKPRQDTHLQISSLKNAEISGEEGSELVMTKRANGIVLSKCENVTLNNIVIDYDPLPFTQGTIIKFKPKKNAILVRIDSGMRSPLEDSFCRGKGVRMRLCFFDAKSGKRNKELDINWIDKVEDGGNGLILLPLRNKIRQGTQIEGLKFAMISRSGYAKAHGVVVQQSRNSVLDNVKMYSAYNAAYLFFESDSSNMSNCFLGLKPGTNRLISSNADGIHAKFNRGPLKIMKSTITYCQDDCVNIAAGYQRVCDQPASNQLVIDMDQNGKAGDEYVFFDFRTAKELARAKSISRKRIKWQGKPKYLLTLDKKLPEFTTVKTTSHQVDWMLNLKTRKELAAMKTIPVFLYNRDACGRGTIIANCLFGHNWPRGILIHSPETTIIKNILVDMTGPGIIAGHDLVWGESPNSGGLKVIDNVFSDICRSNIQIADCALIDSVAGRSIKDIVISGNRFDDFGAPSYYGRGNVGDAISVSNATDIIIENNIIGPPAKNILNPGMSYIQVKYSGKVTVRNNKIIPESKKNYLKCEQ